MKRTIIHLNGRTLKPCKCDGPSDSHHEHGCPYEPYEQFRNTDCAVTDPQHIAIHKELAAGLPEWVK